jgi:hypothetical protein
MLAKCIEIQSEVSIATKMQANSAYRAEGSAEMKQTHLQNINDCTIAGTMY